MPRRSTLLQHVVFQIQRQLAAGATVEESAMLPDNVDGTTREVDVVVRAKIAGHDVLVCVECREHKRPATVGWVEEMAMKHARLPTSKLLLITSAGFSSAAERKARSLGIEALSVDQVTSEDWAWIGSGKFDLWALRIRGCNLEFDTEKIWFSAPSGLPIFRPDGTYRGKVGDIVRSHLECSSDFTEAAIEHAEKTGQCEFWTECESIPPFAVKDPQGVIHVATSIHVRIEMVRSPGTITLTKARLKDVDVAFARGQLPIGEMTISLVRSGGAPITGNLSIENATTGRVQTTVVEFTPHHRKLMFVAGPVRARSEKQGPNPETRR